MKFRLLKADEIECKVSRINQYGVNILLYKTARTDMDLLDETVGPENWTDDYKEIKGNLYCGIGIWVAREGGYSDWIWKWDCGIESRQDADGNEKKGEASDAFKRAGFRWGIGRELYTAPEIFIPAQHLNMKQNEKTGKWATYDKLIVSNIYYDDKRRIKGLVITNQKTRKKVFCFGVDEKVEPDVSATCERCGKAIMPQKKLDGSIWSVKDMVHFSKGRFGSCLCASCMKEVKKNETHN